MIPQIGQQDFSFSDFISGFSDLLAFQDELQAVVSEIAALRQQLLDQRDELAVHFRGDEDGAVPRVELEGKLDRRRPSRQRNGQRHDQQPGPPSVCAAFPHAGNLGPAGHYLNAGPVNRRTELGHCVT